MKTNCEKDPEIPEVKQKDITAKKDGNIFKDFSRQSLALILTLFILFIVNEIDRMQNLKVLTYFFIFRRLC